MKVGAAASGAHATLQLRGSGTCNGNRGHRKEKVESCRGRILLEAVSLLLRGCGTFTLPCLRKARAPRLLFRTLSSLAGHPKDHGKTRCGRLQVKYPLFFRCNHGMHHLGQVSPHQAPLPSHLYILQPACVDDGMTLPAPTPACMFSHAARTHAMKRCAMRGTRTLPAGGEVACYRW